MYNNSIMYLIDNSIIIMLRIRARCIHVIIISTRNNYYIFACIRHKYTAPIIIYSLTIILYTNIVMTKEIRMIMTLT